MDERDLTYAIGLPPEKAVAFLRDKGLRVSARWHDVWERANARAFTVAGLARLDLLADVRDGLTQALREGRTEDWFVKVFVPKLSQQGWARVNARTGEALPLSDEAVPARLRLIFQQNVQSAYMAGRYQEQLVNAADRPWWQYVAVLDSRTRPRHRALNGKIFRFDHPFWKTHYPPNGFRCRCRVRALSDEQMEREGLTPEEGEMVSDERIVNPGAPNPVVRTVWGWKPERGMIVWTDVGFSYNPGREWLGDPLAQAWETAQKTPPTDWKRLGLTDMRHVPDADRLPAPPLLPKAESREAAVRQMETALDFGDAAQKLVATPLGTRSILRDKLPHMVAKEADARERFAGYVLPTLTEPYEIWLREHEDGNLRENFIGLFRQAKHALLVVVRLNRDGSLIWNVMQRDEKGMNRLREGVLVWSKKN